MNIREAQKKASWKMAGGALIGLLCFISTIISMLLMLYHKMDTTGSFGSAIGYQLKRFVYFCYEHTSALHWLWSLPRYPIPRTRSPKKA